MGLDTILLSLLIGAIGSVIASYIFRYNTTKQTPEITLSKHIIKSSTTKGNSLLVKLINNTPRDVINVQLMILGVKYRDPDEKKIKKTMTLSQREIPYFAKATEEDFGDDVISIHLYSCENSDIHQEITLYDEISVFIKAEDPYNNAFAVIHETFSFNEIKDDTYTFHESRNSLTAVRKT